MTLGSILVVGSLLWYQIGVGGSLVIGKEGIGVLEITAYSTLGLIFVGLTVLFLGLTLYLRGASSDRGLGRRSSLMIRLSIMTASRQSARIFTLTALGYGLLFGVVSSTLVFQPGVSFSQEYGVGVPSVVPVVCCGDLGQMPQLIIYVTQHIAILIIPVNLILLFIVSWLVGLNAAIATYAYTNRSQIAGARWISGLGGVVGLFTVCPTCAGFFLLTTLGLDAAATLALTLSSAQTLFIAVGIPILLVSPFLTSRRISNNAACSVTRAHDAMG